MSRIKQPRRVLPYKDHIGNVWAACVILIPIIGLAVTLVALVSQILTNQPCPSQGCAVVSTLATYGEFPILIAGIMLFALLTLFGFCCVFFNKWIQSANNILNCIKLSPQSLFKIIITASFAVEGYLVAVQALVVKTFCPFCMLVLSILILTAVVFALYTRRYFSSDTSLLPLITAVFVSSFLGVVFVTPGTLHITSLSEIAEAQIQKGNPSGTFYLIYGDKCSHCEDVISYCSEFNGDIDVRLCPIEKSKPLLKTLEINSVPTMIVNTPTRMEIIVGSTKIIDYIRSSKTYSALEYSPYHHPFFSEGDSVCSDVSPCIN